MPCFALPAHPAPSLNVEHRLTRPRRNAFSLIEAAIVLGIVGLVIGGIWVAAAAVSQNRIRTDMLANVRDMRIRIAEVWKGIPLTPNAGVYLPLTQTLYPANEVISVSALPEPTRTYWTTMNLTGTHARLSPSGLYYAADSRPGVFLVWYTFGPVNKSTCIWVGMKLKNLIFVEDGPNSTTPDDGHFSISNDQAVYDMYFQPSGYNLGDGTGTFAKNNCSSSNIISIRMGLPISQ